MEKDMIQIKKLKKEYQVGEEKVIALDIDALEIEANAITAIVGTSGSGKSTLMHILGCMDKPTSGSVFLDGCDITTLKEKEISLMRRDKIGFVFQKFCLVQELNVEENILFPALLKSKKTDKEYYDYLVQELKLSDRLHHMPSELSGGQQQRTAIARALMNRPKVLLCDEPTGNLDKKTSEEVIGLLLKIQKELHTTVVLVTHDRSIAEIASTVIQIEDGKIIG
jgi:putative ABC transport system ATP-binding protein